MNAKFTPAYEKRREDAVLAASIYGPESQIAVLFKAGAEQQRLREINADLLAALQDVLRHCVTARGMPDVGKGRTPEQQAAYSAARAALAKAVQS